MTEISMIGVGRHLGKKNTLDAAAYDRKKGAVATVLIVLLPLLLAGCVVPDTPGEKTPTAPATTPAYASGTTSQDQALPGNNAAAPQEKTPTSPANTAGPTNQSPAQTAKAAAKPAEETAQPPTKISGPIIWDTTWSGNILVTGDVTVEDWVTLTILPGTTITVTAFSDDQHGGEDHPRDPPFPKDPDRKETSSTIITIRGTLNATGTPDRRITFTSDQKNTTYDWDGLNINRGRLDYAVVEHARYNNIQETSDVTISNSIIRNSLECCLCIGHYRPVSPLILDNDIYNCGHEGIDNGGGSATIRGNYFHVENPEMQPDPTTGRNGVIIYQNTYPIVENNRFEKLSRAFYFLADSKNKPEGGRQARVRNNMIKNNDAAFGINFGYPMELVLRENNTLVNNTEEEVREGRD